MRKDAELTRSRILDAANSLIMESGYGGTTVDEVIAKAGVTKGAFFYHFKSKEDLAQSLVQRYADGDRVHLDETFRQAEARSDDPAEQLLIISELFINYLRGLPMASEGCLYASFCYQSGLLNTSTLKPIRDMVLYWRQRFAEKIRAAVDRHPPRFPVSVDDLADQALGAFEGGFVLAKTLNDSSVVVRQLEQFRTYLSLVFDKTPKAV